MIPKSSRLYSVVHGKCPRCHQGEIFIYKNPYHKLAFRKIHERCNVCGQAYEPEPGFFQGAMYVSYGVSLFLCVALAGILYLFNLSAEVILIIFSVILLALLPVIFRISRLIWLNLFIGYKPNAAKHAHPQVRAE